MKIGVAGIWHLGAMYSIGLAELGHQVVAYDPNEKAIRDFNEGRLQVYEPGLEAMLTDNLKSQRISFTHQESDLAGVELLIIAYDTPVDENDNADNDFVISELQRLARYIDSSTKIQITSQLPVGSCSAIKNILAIPSDSARVIVQPENLRLGRAIDTFFKAERIIAGTVNGEPDNVISEVFGRLNIPIIWMKDKSAEMTKHALNAFLASSITFMGEISEICEITGADAKEVEIGLKTDSRIGSKAYLSPGLGFAGGTLARDVRTLEKIQSKVRKDSALVQSLIPSNTYNNNWISRTLDKVQVSNRMSRICFWGISYTENTTTLRRSEIYREMLTRFKTGIEISYVENFLITDEIESDFKFIDSVEDSLLGIDALVISKPIKSFRGNVLAARALLNGTFWILDPFRFLLQDIPSLIVSERYFTVGTGR